MSLFDFYEINLFKHLLCSKHYASPNLNHGISQDLNFQDLCGGHVANIFFCHRKSKQTCPRKWSKFMKNGKNFLLSHKVQQNVSKLSSCKFCLCTNIFIICLLFFFFFTLFICYFTVYLNLYLSFITTCKTKLFTSAVFQICLEFHALNIHKILQNH